MFTAALDTSISCSLVIADDNRVVFSETLQAASREHDRQLPQWVLDSARKVGAELKDIRRWTVGTGPGSFAGLRSGIALIKGICAATGASLRGVPSAIATAAGAAHQPGGRVGVIMDGRCGQILLAVVRDGKLEGVPAALNPGELLEEGNFCQAWITPQPALIPPLPESIQDLLQKLEAFDPSPLLFDDTTPWPAPGLETDRSCEPLYVRPPVFVQPVELKHLFS